MVRNEITSLSHAAGFDEEWTGRIVLAIDEAITNIIRHTYKNDPEGDTYRPSEFYVGSREFDPKKVGFRYDRANAGFTEFDTSLRGNSNHGHEYGAGLTPQADGRTVLPALSEEQRRDLVEYLKTL